MSSPFRPICVKCQKECECSRFLTEGASRTEVQRMHSQSRSSLYYEQKICQG